MSYSQYIFFGEQAAPEALSQHGDRLVELECHNEWRVLVKMAEKIWRPVNEKKAVCGSKLWSAEVLLSVLVLERLHNLSDEQTDYQLRNRLSFQRFAGLGLGGAVPDSRTIGLYTDQFAKADGGRELFDAFQKQLAERGVLMKEGVIVDTTVVEVPRQLNFREENEKIKQGEMPPDSPQHPRKLAQKDMDACLTKKNDQTYYGYKDHVKVGAKTKIILDNTTTAASTHDSQAMPELIVEGECSVHADSAYTGSHIAADLRAKSVRKYIHEKGTCGAPLGRHRKTLTATNLGQAPGWSMSLRSWKNRSAGFIIAVSPLEKRILNRDDAPLLQPMPLYATRQRPCRRCGLMP